MSLSVGVVSINYLKVPQPPVADFLKDLAMNPSIGSEDGNYWGGGWSENTFLEFELEALVEGTEIWCDDKDVDDGGRTALVTWVSSLPSNNGYVMLHLGL